MRFNSSIEPASAKQLVFALGWACTWLVFASIQRCPAESVGEEFFEVKLYPALLKAQCESCHNDNGVASVSELKFPSRSAGSEQIRAFGFKLAKFVDRQNPLESPLLRKPTQREEHTGGVRVLPGSDSESQLIEWIRFLANMNEEAIHQAQQRIEKAERWELQPLTLRRLTHSQYNNTVRDLLGDESQPANRFPKEDFVRGFKNQAEGQGISPIQAEAYSAAAERLARSAFRGGDHRKLLPIEPISHNDPNAARRFVEDFGRKAFRRPLKDEEVSKYVRLLIDNANSSNNFLMGAASVIEAMLQSPLFLFRVESNQAELASYEVASRLSYLLWDSMPSPEMFTKASEGRYQSNQVVEEEARDMLKDPKALSALDEFLAQWLRFDRVLNATRDRRRFREFNSELAAAMISETQALFHHLVEKELDFMEFFTADYTFVNSNLAKVYGLPDPKEEFALVRYPKGTGRSGILGHGSFLTGTSKPSETSPTSRGLFIRNQFLAQEIAPPPPGINAVLPEVTEDQPLTNRQRLDIHLNSDACSGCHRLIDPVGFAFETYDAIGGFQEKMIIRLGTRENPITKELELDTSSYLQGFPGSVFNSPLELGKILAESEICQRCIVKQYFRYAFGREESERDQAILEDLYRRFRDSGFRFREMIVALVTSKLFLQRNG